MTQLRKCQEAILFRLFVAEESMKNVTDAMSAHQLTGQIQAFKIVLQDIKVLESEVLAATELNSESAFQEL